MLRVPSVPISTEALRRLLAAVSLALLGCDAEPVPHASVSEPDEALRPVQQRGEVPERARIADYRIQARLDSEAHRIEGDEVIVWRNRTAHTTDRLPMHLYMNAFRAEDTAWMRMGRGTHRGQMQGSQQPWGYIDVGSVARLESSDPSAGVAAPLPFVEGEDPSVMEVQLDQPVPPGGEIAIRIDFVTQLPEVFARTGFADDFHMVGQWYPKVGVLEPDGQWRTHVFTFHSEFYADFGDYDVTLDVPSGMVVGATGIRVQEHDDAQRKIVQYRARMVHDFAWTAWHDFESFEREVDGIRVRVLVPPGERSDAAVHLEAQEQALASMQQRYGPYPWSTITIVQPPRQARGAMGMEYPTFYTTSDVRRLPWPLPALGYRNRMSGALTTVHEFGHQYFQGLLASDEQREPWLDEGMNTFSNAMVAEDWWGEDPWLLLVAGQELTVSDLMRLQLRGARGLEPIAQPAEGFDPLLGLYSPVVYTRTAALMSTLRNLAGHEAFDAALREYTLRYRFAHPTGEHLVQTLETELDSPIALAEASEDLPGSGRVELDVRDFLEQGLHTPATLDYAVRKIVHRPKLGSTGWRRDEQGVLVEQGEVDRRPVSERPSSELESVVQLQRVGQMQVPVQVEVEFSDGSTQRLWWDGRARARSLVFVGRKVVRAALDPEGDLVLESHRLDNHRYARTSALPGSGPAADLGELGEALTLALLVGLGP